MSDLAEIRGYPLDADQAAAARHDGDRPALVLAGPGAGKTRTLVGRVLYLASKGYHPSEVKVVTFTKPAATEVAERIGAHLDIDTRGMPWGTFHAQALRALQRHHDAAGLPARIGVATGDVGREILRDLGVWWPAEDGGDILDIIAAEKERMGGALQFRERVERMVSTGEIRKDHWLPRAADVFDRYEAELVRRDMLDFGDLIGRLVRLFDEQEDIRRFEASRYRTLLVDEYQDSNGAQVRLVSQLTRDHGRLWVVGDDDQMMYSFRGSEAHFILGFDRHFPGAQIYHLTRNYRSTPPIVAAGRSLVSVNLARFDKPLVAVNDGVGAVPVRITGYEDALAEAAGVASDLAERRRHGQRLSSCAVLFRSSSVAPAIQAALGASGVPCRVQGAGSIGRAPGARAVLAALLWADDPDNREAGTFAGTDRRRRAIREMCGAVAAARSPAEVASILAPLGPPGPVERDSFVAAAEAGAAMARDRGLKALLAEARGDAHGAVGDAVVLCTAHAAKGLEFDVVHVVGCESDTWPNGLAGDVEEERRIAYVAFTRARKDLIISWAARRANRRRDASPFLHETVAGLSREAVVIAGLPLGPKVPARSRSAGAKPSTGVKRPAFQRAPAMQTVLPVATWPEIKAPASVPVPVRIAMPTSGTPVARPPASLPLAGATVGASPRPQAPGAARKRLPLMPDLAKIDFASPIAGRRRLDNMAHGIPPRAGVDWSQPELDWLAAAIEGGMATASAAKMLTRSVTEVEEMARTFVPA